MIVGFSDFQQEDRNQGEDSTGDTAGKGLETGGQKSLQRVQHTRGGAREKSVLIYLPFSAPECLHISREADTSRAHGFIISFSFRALQWLGKQVTKKR